MQAATHRVARGDMRTELGSTGTQELDELASDFNQMVRQIAERDGASREFLMRVTHDLRTPLTAIRGHAAALSDGIVPEDDVPRSLAAIEGEAARLETLVADLLDLARLDAHRFKLDLTRVEPTEVLDTAFDAMEAEAAMRGVAYERAHRRPRAGRDRRDPRAPDRGQPARQRHPLDAARAARFASRGARAPAAGSSRRSATPARASRPSEQELHLRPLPVAGDPRRTARQRPGPGHQPAARPGAGRRGPRGEPGRRREPLHPGAAGADGRGGSGAAGLTPARLRAGDRRGEPPDPIHAGCGRRRTPRRGCTGSAPSGSSRTRDGAARAAPAPARGSGRASAAGSRAGGRARR